MTLEGDAELGRRCLDLEHDAELARCAWDLHDLLVALEQSKAAERDAFERGRADALGFVTREVLAGRMTHVVDWPADGDDIVSALDMSLVTGQGGDPETPATPTVDPQETLTDGA